MRNTAAMKLSEYKNKLWKATFAASLIAVLTLALWVAGGHQPTVVQAATGASLFLSTDDTWAVGTWEGGYGDAGATYRVTLTLNADGTYRKTLATNIGVGGTHSGTWSLKGTTMYLSGDGNWPPYSHDLSKFRKVN